MIRTKHVAVVMGVCLSFFLIALLVVLVLKVTAVYGSTQSGAVILGTSEAMYDVIRVSDRSHPQELREALLTRLDGRTNLAHVPLDPTYYEGERVEDAEASEIANAVKSIKMRELAVVQNDDSTVTVAVPKEPVRAAKPQELTSNVIGVSVNGRLMQNAHGGAYDSLVGTAILVGYALDGFGIYPNSGATNLDQCGGRVSQVLWNDLLQEVYHYEVSSAPRVLGCFSGIPTELP